MSNIKRKEFEEAINKPAKILLETENGNATMNIEGNPVALSRLVSMSMFRNETFAEVVRVAVQAYGAWEDKEKDEEEKSKLN